MTTSTITTHDISGKLKSLVSVENMGVQNMECKYQVGVLKGVRSQACVLIR